MTTTTTTPRAALAALANQSTRPTDFLLDLIAEAVDHELIDTATLLDLGGQLLDSETTWHDEPAGPTEAEALLDRYLLHIG